MLYASAPSLQFLQPALVVMALCNFVLGVGMFFLVQVRYSQNLARRTRRLSLANLIVSPGSGKNLEDLWAVAARDDREAIEKEPSLRVALSCVLSLGRLKASAAVPALVRSLTTLPRSIPEITLTAVLANALAKSPRVW